jgi:hypothetical protein
VPSVAPCGWNLAPGMAPMDCRLSTAAAALAVAGIAACVSYGHAFAVVRAHGEIGITARLEPATIDGLVYASSMVVLYAARHRVPVPSLARWLLALGNRRYTYRESGTGLVSRPLRGSGRSLAGGQPSGLIRTPGLAHPHLQGSRSQAVTSAPPPWRDLPCCDASSPGLNR